MDSIWSLSNPARAARPAGRARRHLRMHAGLALLLAMSVAGLVVVADRAITTWTDGHLFVAWLAGWAVIFAATALLDSWHRQRRASASAAAQAALSAEQSAGVRRLAAFDHSRDGGYLPYL